MILAAIIIASSVFASLYFQATTTTNSQTENWTSTSAAITTSSLTQSSATPPIKHVIIILMENEAYQQVIGSASAPYENSLASHYASAANYFALTHPSLPNYFALVAGDTFGVTSDCLPNQCNIAGPTIASLLDSHGLTWKEYAESMPVNCSQNNSADGLYVTKHDPFVYFSSITNNTGSGATSEYCDSHVISFSQFWTDLQASNLPNYSFITPNICNDAHSCPLSTGDAWLSTVIPKIVNSSSFGSTAIFVTYDEGSGSTPNSPSQVTCILVSPFARQGFTSDVYYTHYSLLATVEAILGVGNLGRNDATATVMSDLFTISIP
jgi:phosphatidylinositol-3-phosphatase